MTTVNIVTDYLAVADATQVFIPITASGTTVSAPSAGSAVWAPGDVTKMISIGHAGGDGPGGGSFYNGTIQTVAGDGKSITVTPAVSFAITAETVVTAWAATNNATAFTNFKNDFQGMTVTLTIPAGVYLIVAGNLPLFSGITNLTVNGTGATLTGGIFDIGSAANFQTGSTHSARTVTANAGDPTITLVTASEASRFAVGRWCCMAGIDLQGSGAPPSFQVFEFVLPTNITGAVVTLTTPLKYTYLSTWPHYSSLGLDYGGPATLYDLDSKWDYTVVFNGLTIAYNDELNASGRSLTFNTCSFVSKFGPFPSVNQSWIVNSCTFSAGVNMEVDKIIDVFTMNTVDLGGGTLTIQTASCNLMTLNNVSLGSMWCTTNNVLNNCTISTVLTLGPVNYGVSQSLIVTNCSIASIGYASYTDTGSVSNSGSLNTNGVTMNNGVMRFNLSTYFSGLPVRWAVPGSIIFWQDATNGWAEPSFRVAAVTQDPVTNDVLLALANVPPTNLTGGFPLLPSNATGYLVRPHPMKSCTFRNCTGAEVQVASLNNAPAGAPFGSYQTLTYTSTMGATHQPSYAVFGNLTSLSVNVNRAYAGAGALSFSVGPSWPVLNVTNNSTVPGGSAGTIFYDAVVNAKSSGLRTITLAGVTGSQAGDTGLTVTSSQQTWFTGPNAGLGPFFSADVSGTDPNVSVTVTWQTDQYFPTSQSATSLGLRMRLRT